MRHINLNSRVVVQYLLTIVNVFVSFVYLILNYNGCVTWFSFIVQSFICLSSNICSVACTISYLVKNDEDDDFQNNRTICIVSTLVLNLVLTMFFAKEKTIIRCQEWSVLIISALVLMFIFYKMIAIQRIVDQKNTNKVNGLNQYDRAEVAEAKKQETGRIGEEVYNIVGENQ